MNQFKKQWKKAFGGDSSQNGEGNQYKGTNGQGNQESQASGQGNQNSGSKGNDGNCTN